MTFHGLAVALTLLTLVVTLARSCQMMRGFVCLPDQSQCRRMGGKCSMTDGRCQCVPEYTFYGYSASGLYSGAGNGYNPTLGGAYRVANHPKHPPAAEVEPAGHPLGEANIERNTNLMVNFARMYNMMS